MHVTRLRLSGFKSFVDPTEVHFVPGLTGIVGPNGCGKSNIVDALRWVMGEAAPKQMRGGEMDDVIFAGTSARPARNIAEVLLNLDNADQSVAVSGVRSAEIDVTRRVERGRGSLYRINGREARARDVQTLFADGSSGARATAIVGQGRIADVINAKPTERRAVLEEAAGIAGLHARRHETELRLHAAEANLARLEDMIETLDEQHRALKRQARQANRYRGLGAQLRRTEAMLLHRRWTSANAATTAALDALREAEDRVAEQSRVAARAAADYERAAGALPGLRAAERDAAQLVQGAQKRRDALAAEESRIESARRTLDARLDQIDGDLALERGRSADARQALERLDGERAALREVEAGLAASAEALAARLADTDRAVAASEAKRDDAQRVLTAAESRRHAIEDRLRGLAAQRGRIEDRRRGLGREQADRDGEAALEAALEAAEAAAALAVAAFAAAGNRLEAAENAQACAEEARAASHEALRATRIETDGLETESGALASLMKAEAPGGRPAVMDAVSVVPGYEAALGAALGDDLLAPDDEAAPRHWRALGPDPGAPPLPAGARPLSDLVSAPAALRRRLDQIGLVEDEAAAESRVGDIVQGQRLVTGSGALWRWDGYRIAAGTETPSAVRLAQRNRLAELERGLAAARAAQAAAARREAEARAGLAAAAAETRAARAARRSAEAAMNVATEAKAGKAARLAAARLRCRANEDARAALTVELAETDSQLAEARRERDMLPDLAAARAAAEDARRGLARVRGEAEHARRDHQRSLAEMEARRRRIGAIETETASWRARAADYLRHDGILEARREEARIQLQALDGRPAALKREMAALDRQIADAGAGHDRAVAALADAEAEIAAGGRAVRAAETELADRREERVRRDAARERAEAEARALSDTARERLGCAPDEALAAAGPDAAADIPDIPSLESRLARLLRARENMGPVNLRADMEADALGKRISEIHDERADLLGAISRLRRAIAELNREGRARLLTAFETVDGNYRAIFTRLFGGGQARLVLTEDEDPFACGLEVMASPPGKRLRAMSLMSGGEKVLSALSLLFAIARTNPAPICVLDEVDAALDDQNVERFCDLLSETAAETGMRFAIVTHHRLTMARMERLYGVTMTEPGVSRIVSVDLQTADRLRESA